MSNSESNGRPADAPAKPYSASAFMRNRRPEQYSDSTDIEAPALDRSVFEYHLETLTSRGEEKVFEHFCRKLGQKELCPNLRPQTGPTGGGDSKVDSETYPVAPEISERWYEGEVAAGSERWAFAFSAKKDWRAKVRADVNSIVGTGRSYALIYFISNQFVPDKDRSAVEDALSKQHGVPVRILDRSWIMERVFDREHFALAIETLNIEISSSGKKRQLGISDANKRARLDELEAQISDQDRYIGVEYQLAEDCLDAAIWARQLELPRVEVDGRFDRAERIASKVGSPAQTLRVKYQKAWTACYWYDDFETVNRLYDEIAALALASTHADDLERLCNIWTTLAAGVRAGNIRATEANLVERIAALRSRLDELVNDDARPNNAAHARTLRCILIITESPFDKQKVGDSLETFASILRSAEHLGGYPFDQYFDFFKELGEVVGDNAAYDPAFESLLPLIERRRSEGAAGVALLERGLQKVATHKPYEVIGLLGRAQQKLIKQEHHRELVACLMGMSVGYMQAGLLWASHASALAAASVALAVFPTEGRIEFQALRAVQQLVWIELQLGRVSHILTHIQFQDALAAHLQLDGVKAESFRDQRHDQDMMLAALLLLSSTEQLRTIGGLVPALERLRLFGSGMALLYALGYNKTLVSEGYIPPGTPTEDVERTLRQLANAQGTELLPSQPQLFTDAQVTLESSVLGCRWRVYVSHDEVTLRIAEALLGFVEAFFATSLGSDAIPHREYVDIRIRSGERPPNASGDFWMALDRPDSLIEIGYSPSYDPSREMVDHKLRNFLQDVLGVVIARVIFAPDLEKWLDRIAGAEEGFGRSLTFADVFTSASNVLGEKPVFTLEPWLSKERKFEFIRDRAVEFKDKNIATGQTKPTRYGTGEPTPEMMDTSGIRHRDRRVVSVIEVELWDAARWGGVGFAYYDDYPPFLALQFENGDAARQIFENWRSRFGKRDEDSAIRVAIITGIDQNAPTSYSVTISADVESVLKGSSEFAVVTSRIKTIENPQSNTVEMIGRLQDQYGCFFLAPSTSVPERREAKVMTEIAILKRGLIIRPAWQISENDPDLMAINPEYEPIIPEGEVNPPIIRALERIRSRRRYRSDC